MKERVGHRLEPVVEKSEFSIPPSCFYDNRVGHAPECASCHRPLDKHPSVEVLCGQNQELVHALLEIQYQVNGMTSLPTTFRKQLSDKISVLVLGKWHG